MRVLSAMRVSPSHSQLSLPHDTYHIIVTLARPELGINNHVTLFNHAKVCGACTDKLGEVGKIIL